ncbi:MAG: hypothetical protein ACREBR_00035 [bacterium]
MVKRAKCLPARFSSTRLANELIQKFTPPASIDPPNITLHGTPIQITKIPPRPMIHGDHPGRNSAEFSSHAPTIASDLDDWEKKVT